MEELKLTRDQVILAKQRVAAWLRIREANDKGFTYGWDADHSALLERLLSGKPALPKPPPLRMGYPDYEAAGGRT